jgi:hypothetical protein
MLLVSQDFLSERPDFDSFSAAMFVPEVAQLGNSLDEIRELGPEAERKLAALPSTNVCTTLDLSSRWRDASSDKGIAGTVDDHGLEHVRHENIEGRNVIIGSQTYSNVSWNSPHSEFPNEH